MSGALGGRVDSSQFLQAAQALNEAANGDLRRKVYAEFRRAATPLGQKMIAEGSQVLPARGGLRAVIEQATVSVSNATTGKNPGVRLKLKAPGGYDLGAMDRGVLRHPVYGNRNAWVTQQIPPLAFTTPFQAGAEPVRRKIMQILQNLITP